MDTNKNHLSLYNTTLTGVFLHATPQVQFHKHQSPYKTSHQWKTRNRSHTKMSKNIVCNQHTMKRNILRDIRVLCCATKKTVTLHYFMESDTI